MAGGLPWIRLDANIATHDKIVQLLSDGSPKRWQAAASYMFGLAWSGGQGTDGKIFPATLPMIHGTAGTAGLLVKYKLWESAVPNGWHIRNFEARQELAAVTEAKKTAQKVGAIKGNCIRHHGPDCGCWRNSLGAIA